MCIAPKIDAKTHVPGCSMKDAKAKKTTNVPEDDLLQLIFNEQFATSIEF